MARIELDEAPLPGRVILAQTLLRAVLGLILFGHGAQQLAQFHAFCAPLVERLGREDGQALGYVIVGSQLAAGVGLVLGWFTRASAFVLIATSATALASAPPSRWMVTAGHPAIELALVLCATGALFVFAGGGRFSLDLALRERRRRRAIEKDPIWSRPPYVPHPSVKNVRISS